MANVLQLDAIDDDVIRDIGALFDFEFGTYLILFKRLSIGSPHRLICLTTTAHGQPSSSLMVSFDQMSMTEHWNPSNVHPPTIDADVAWIALVRKVGGSAAPRFSIQNKATGTWYHGNGAAALADTTNNPGLDGDVRFSTRDNAELAHVRVAAAAVWKNINPWSADVLGDIAIENAGLGVYQNWINKSPTASWRFTKMTPIADDTGNGADEISRVGTTLVDDPDFNFFNFALAADVEAHEGDGLASTITLVPGTGAGTPAITTTGQASTVELVAGAGTGTPAAAADAQASVIQVEPGAGQGAPDVTGAGDASLIVLTPGAGSGTAGEAHSGDGLASSITCVPQQGGGTPAIGGDGATAPVQLIPGEGTGTPHIGGQVGTAVVLLVPGTGSGFAPSSITGFTIGDDITGPARREISITGPAMKPLATTAGLALSRTVTGPATARTVSGPTVKTITVTGPASTDKPEPGELALSRTVTGPALARTVTGPDV